MASKSHQNEPNRAQTMCRGIRRKHAALKTNDLEVMSTSIDLIRNFEQFGDKLGAQNVQYYMDP